jgi:hypothetical protein
MSDLAEDLATLREALFHATRSTSALDRSPVPGTPIGDAHVALDRVEAELSRLIDLVRGGNCIRDESGMSPCERLTQELGVVIEGRA